MSGFEHSNSKHGQLSINSVNMMCPAWRIMNLATLWTRAARGDDLVIPLADGQKSRARRKDRLVLPMVLRVSGTHSSAGTPAANPYSQLATNMVALEAVSINPSGTTGHASTWTLPNGTTRTANVWIQNWGVSDDQAAPINIVTFDLVIPSGGYA